MNATSSSVPFAAGQVRKYQTRPGEENSRIIICRVEPDAKLGTIVHIQVNGLRMKNKHAPGGFGDVVGHMPYDQASLRKTVTSLESSGAKLPQFEDGYRQWRSAFDADKAGIWTASVADAIAGMEKALNQ